MRLTIERVRLENSGSVLRNIMKTTTLFLFSLFAASLPEFAQNTGSTTIPVAVLPTAANATLGRVYRWSEGTAPNTCPAAGGGGTGGSVIVFCVTLDNATWRPVVIGDTATANILTNPMNALGDMISGGTAGAPTQVPGNTSTTLKVLTQTGDGTHSAAPVWQLPPAPGTLTYYFTPTTNFGSYLSQTTSPYSPKTTLNYTSLATGTDTLQNWITPVGSPGLSFIPAGSFEFHIHALRTGGGTVKIYAEVWEADSSGGDIKKIGTTETSAALTTSEVEYRLFFSTIDVYNLANTSSRIVTRVIVTVSGSSPTVQLFVGGEADSHISLPTNTVDASNFVPYTGATKDVDIGAHAYKSNQSDGCATWSSNALGSTGTACGSGTGGNTITVGTRAALPLTSSTVGNLYKCNDSPYEFIWNGSSWDAYVFGYNVTEPILANLTQINVDKSTFDTTHGGILQSVPGQGGTDVQLLGQAIPASGAYYVDAAFIPLVTQPNGNCGSGVSQDASASNPFSYSTYGIESGSNWWVERSSWSNSTTFSDNKGTGYIVQTGPLIWTRLYDDRTTNRTFYISPNGYAWYQIYQEPRTTLFTPGEAILAVQPFSSSVIVHWVHFSVHP
jgi:hypothetical protein